MQLKILLPFKVFTERQHVRRIVAGTLNGSFGILPQRLDCVAPLTPGIFTFETEQGPEENIAIDHGVLIKFGSSVFVSVRNAIGGADLGSLRDTVQREFLGLEDREQASRAVSTKLENGFVRRFLRLHHDS